MVDDLPENHAADTARVDASDVTDAKRADELQDYLAAFAAEFWTTPKLMPLDDEGKAPIIKGRCRLDTEQGRSYLISGHEAVERIREDGARGFALYAGKDDHGTADAVFVDHDDMAAFPAPTGDPTLAVRSGSGRGVHETYRNAGDVRNARVGDDHGEIRAKNWYVIVPGSIHPSGGVYHIQSQRPIATLADADLEDHHRPTARANGGATATTATAGGPATDPAPDYSPADDPPTPEAVADAEPWVARYVETGADDRSTKDYAVCRAMAEYGVPEADTRDFLADSDQTKVHERGEQYWRQTWASAVSDADTNSKTLDTTDNSTDDNRPPVLPPTPTTQPGRNEHITLTQDDARERCQRVIRDVIDAGERVVVDALPSLGKSYTAATVAASVDVPMTYLTHRWENREQVAEWAREAGLRVNTLPSFDRDCPTAAGEHGDDQAERFTRLRNRGIPPKQIHQLLGTPCQANGRCPYVSKWDFDADDYDVIIGWTGHANVPRVVDGRAVILDEDPGNAFETRLGDHGLRRAVSVLLSERNYLPGEDVDDLLSIRKTDAALSEAVAAVDTIDDLRDVNAAIDARGGRADAPALVYGLLTADDVGNGFERAELPTGETFVRDTETGEVTLRMSPDLADAHAVVGLDGTTFMQRWRGCLGLDGLVRRQVLDDDERQTYLADTLGNRYIQTTDDVKPCLSGTYINVNDATQLLRWVDERHGGNPALITSTAAEAQLVDDDGPAAGYVDGTEHFGNLKGSNQFEDRAVGVVLGSPQLGDREIQRRAALDGHAVEPTREGRSSVTFGPIGDEYLRHTRDDRVGQAALRFGRDESVGGATVYIHTSAVPDWLPVERRRVPADGERRVMRLLATLREASTSEISAETDMSDRQCREYLRILTDRGFAKQTGTGPTTAYEWILGS